MAKFSIMYLAVCEAVFGGMVGCVGLFILIASGFSFSVQLKPYLVGSGLDAMSVLSVWAGAALIWKRRWAWHMSLIVGFVVVSLSCLIIWLAMHADHSGDGGEAVIFGIAFLLFALPGFVLLSLSSTRQHLLSVNA